MKKLFAIIVFSVLTANAWADENNATPYDEINVNCAHTHASDHANDDADVDYGPEGG